MDNIVKIAETVAKGMMPKLDQSKVDMNKIWNQTKDMANKCQDKDGNSLFQGGTNPLSLLTGFMERQMGMSSPMNNNNNNNSNNNNQNKMTEADYERECMKMMKEMGLPDMPPEMLKQMPINKLLSDFDNKNLVKSEKTKSSKSSKSSKNQNKHKHK